MKELTSCHPNFSSFVSRSPDLLQLLLVVDQLDRLQRQRHVLLQLTDLVRRKLTLSVTHFFDRIRWLHSPNFFRLFRVVSVRNFRNFFDFFGGNLRLRRRLLLVLGNFCQVCGRPVLHLGAAFEVVEGKSGKKILCSRVAQWPSELKLLKRQEIVNDNKKILGSSTGLSYL